MVGKKSRRNNNRKTKREAPEGKLITNVDKIKKNISAGRLPKTKKQNELDTAKIKYIDLYSKQINQGKLEVKIDWDTHPDNKVRDPIKSEINLLPIDPPEKNLNLS